MNYVTSNLYSYAVIKVVLLYLCAGLCRICLMEMLSCVPVIFTLRSARVHALGNGEIVAWSIN